MSMSDAFVTVTCDKCNYESERIGLTALAGGGWDERHVAGEVEGWGWRTEGDTHTCENCLEDEEDGDSEA